MTATPHDPNFDVRAANKRFAESMKGNCVLCKQDVARARGLCTRCYQDLRRAGDLEMFPPQYVLNDPEQFVRMIAMHYPELLSDILIEYGEIYETDRKNTLAGGEGKADGWT